MAAEPRPALLARKKLIKAVEETTSGTHGTCVLLAGNFYDIKCEPGDFFAEGDRLPDGNYVGRTSSVLGKQMGKLSYKHDVTPAGIFIASLTGAGYASGVPSSDLSARKTWSFEVYEDGLMKIVDGAVCNIVLDFEQGKKLVATYEWSGIWGAVTDAAMPAQAPIATMPYVCRGMNLTMAAAAIAKISKMQIDLGCAPEEREDLTAASGIAHFLIGEILPKGSLDPEARKVADQDAYGLFLAGTTAAFSTALIGGGHTLTISAPVMQRVKVGSEERGKRATHPLEINFCSSAGNDALSLVET